MAPVELLVFFVHDCRYDFVALLVLLLSLAVVVVVVVVEEACARTGRHRGGQRANHPFDFELRSPANSDTGCLYMRIFDFLSLATPYATTTSTPTAFESLFS